VSTSGIVGEQIENQAALAGTALQDIEKLATGPSTSQMFARAVLKMLAPYSVALYFAERVAQSPTFDPELVRTLHDRLLPLERMVDAMLAAAKQRGYFDDPEAGEPLRWLETCNEQVKDYMVALESMLDPRLDDLMAETLEEHQRGETVPLDSIR
jgi:hypothetical protein